MSEPQPPIPAEDLDRMMNNARDHYPIDDTYTIQGAGKQVEKRACYFQGAKAEHCHLRERIASLEEENSKLRLILRDRENYIDTCIEHWQEIDRLDLIERARKDLAEISSILNKQP